MQKGRCLVRPSCALALSRPVSCCTVQLEPPARPTTAQAVSWQRSTPPLWIKASSESATPARAGSVLQPTASQSQTLDDPLGAHSTSPEANRACCPAGAARRVDNEQLDFRSADEGGKRRRGRVSEPAEKQTPLAAKSPRARTSSSRPTYSRLSRLLHMAESMFARASRSNTHLCIAAQAHTPLFLLRSSTTARSPPCPPSPPPCAARPLAPCPRTASPPPSPCRRRATGRPSTC